MGIVSLVENQKALVRSLCVGIAVIAHNIERLPTDILIDGFVRLRSSTCTLNGPIARYVVAGTQQPCQRPVHLLTTRLGNLPTCGDELALLLFHCA